MEQKIELLDKFPVRIANKTSVKIPEQTPRLGPVQITKELSGRISERTTDSTGGILLDVILETF